MLYKDDELFIIWDSFKSIISYDNVENLLKNNYDKSIYTINNNFIYTDYKYTEIAVFLYNKEKESRLEYY